MSVDAPSWWGWAWSDERDQAERAISTGQLHALLRFHTRPIDVVVFHGSSGRTRFEVGFELRCLQLLSRPYIATLHCGWRHNRSTRGTFVRSSRTRDKSSQFSYTHGR